MPCATSVEVCKATRLQEMLFFGGQPHIMNCIMVQASTSANLMHLNLLRVSGATYEFSDTPTTYSRRGSWERRRVKPRTYINRKEAGFPQKEYWTNILAEFVSDTALVLGSGLPN